MKSPAHEWLSLDRSHLRHALVESQTRTGHDPPASAPVGEDNG